LCAKEALRIERQYTLSGYRRVTLFPNLMAEVAVFLVSK
jgi:hypothetical protein